MMKTVGWMLMVNVVVAVLAFVLFEPNDAFCMGWTPPEPPEPPVDPGPVAAPEPGTLTLIGMAVSAGAGYLLGKRKK